MLESDEPIGFLTLSREYLAAASHLSLERRMLGRRTLGVPR